VLDRAVRARTKDIGIVFRVGIVSDTHGLLRPQVEQVLAGVDHIIHGGDIGGPDIMERLRRIAPVTAIRGNVDSGAWAEQYPETTTLQLGGRTIYVLHDRQQLTFDPALRGIDVVVSGHSHRPRTDTIDGVLYLNPGSAGPRRFNLPVTVAKLVLTAKQLRPLIQELGLAG
jgi:putative phosphoesterase